MKHPTILPGRQGLPPTSNVPWSAFLEKHARVAIVFFFVMFWAGVVMVISGLWLHIWSGSIAMAIFSVAMYCLLSIYRRELYAMLLNKPRDIANLTQWTEHRWRGWTTEDRQFFCACGRMVDLSAASYFKSTSRYAMVCECGAGHFQIPPKIGRIQAAQ
jgi:hypothetical protein